MEIALQNKLGGICWNSFSFLTRIFESIVVLFEFWFLFVIKIHFKRIYKRVWDCIKLHYNLILGTTVEIFYGLELNYLNWIIRMEYIFVWLQIFDTKKIIWKGSTKGFGTGLKLREKCIGGTAFFHSFLFWIRLVK